MATNDERLPECACGCGAPAPIAGRTDRKRGYIRGLPVRFIPGHSTRAKATAAPEDIRGRRFGSLVALTLAGPDKSGRVRWRCRCDCGAIRLVRACGLKSGNSTSCGCSHRVHGQAVRGCEGRTYRTWQQMLQRCNNPKAPMYPNYGARGIRVCDRWHSFAGFLADMGLRPEDKTLDRYPDGNGNYEPGNCRWATTAEQARNRRDSVWVLLNSERMVLQDAANRLGRHRATLASAIAAGTHRRFGLEVCSDR